MQAAGRILTTVIVSAFIVTTCLAQQTRKLPCDATHLEVAADGSGIWLACSRELAALKRPSGSDSNSRAPYVGTRKDPTDLYWLPTASSEAIKIASAQGMIQIVPAPRGAHALVVMPAEKGWGTVFLNDQQTKVKKLPIDSYFLQWSADAKKVYFYGGSTIQADAWNILGIYDLDTGQVQRRHLQSPTEIVRVCLKSGNVYSATPAYPGSAAKTAEYDSDIHYLRQIRDWVGARFSAGCSFVASEADYHGPLPWKIFETGTGKELFSFDAVDEEDKQPSYSLLQWNPKYESLMLREHNLGNGVSVLEVFNVRTGKVVQQLPEIGTVAWSANGESVLVADGSELKSYPIPAGMVD